MNTEIRAVKHRLYPTPEQEAVMLRTLRLCRQVWNHLHATRFGIPLKLRELDDETRARILQEREAEPKGYIRGYPHMGRLTGQWLNAKWPVRNEMRKAAVAWVRDRFAEEIEAGVYQSALQWVANDFDEAIRRWMKGLAQRPRWKRFDTDLHGYAVDIRGELPRLPEATGERHIDALRLPKVGPVRIRYRSRWDGRGLPKKDARVVYAAGQWHLSIKYEVPTDHLPRRKRPAPGSVVGIDLGVTATITDSTGAYHDIDVRALEEEIDRLKSRRDKGHAKGSYRWRLLDDRIARRQARRNRVLDAWVRRIARLYADRYETVVSEDLAVRNMTASAKGDAEEPGRNVRQKAGLNRSILRNRFYAVRRAFEAAGCRVVVVPPAYTSQTCNACGHVDAEARDGKVYRCTACGHEADADVNAARNILGLYLSNMDRAA